MSFPIRCTECGHAMTQGEDFDRCDNGACQFAGYELPNDEADPPPLDWTDELGTAA